MLLLLACDPTVVTPPDDSAVVDSEETGQVDPCAADPQPVEPDPGEDCPGMEGGLFAIEEGSYWLSQPAESNGQTETLLFLGGGGADQQGVQFNLQGLLGGDERLAQIRIVAPWVGDSDRASGAMAALAEVQECFGGDLSRVHLRGHRSGGYVAFSLVLEQRFTTLIGFPALFDASVEDAELEQSLECVPVLNAVGEEDSWRSQVEGTHERLEELGLDSTLWVVEGEGHVPGPDFDSGPIYDWIAAH